MIDKITAQIAQYYNIPKDCIVDLIINITFNYVTFYINGDLYNVDINNTGIVYESAHMIKSITTCKDEIVEKEYCGECGNEMATNHGDHWFAGYGFYIEYCQACCPGYCDGMECVPKEDM